MAAGKGPHGDPHRMVPTWEQPTASSSTQQTAERQYDVMKSEDWQGGKKIWPSAIQEQDEDIFRRVDPDPGWHGDALIVFARHWVKIILFNFVHFAILTEVHDSSAGAIGS